MRLLIFGAGGHAKVVIDAALACGLDIAGIVGERGGRTEILGFPVSESAEGMNADGFIVAIGDNRRRARVFAENDGGRLRPLTVIHPSAVIAPGVEIGDGSFLAAGAIVNIDARIGRNVVLNTGCTVDHDCVVGDHSLVGPTASMCGESRIGEGVTLGAGASVIPVKRVGDWSIVGAGAAVVRDMPAGIVCAGVPARTIRGIED